MWYDYISLRPKIALHLPSQTMTQRLLCLTACLYNRLSFRPSSLALLVVRPWSLALEPRCQNGTKPHIIGWTTYTSFDSPTCIRVNYKFSLIHFITPFIVFQISFEHYPYLKKRKKTPISFLEFFKIW